MLRTSTELSGLMIARLSEELAREGYIHSDPQDNNLLREMYMLYAVVGA